MLPRHYGICRGYLIDIPARIETLVKNCAEFNLFTWEIYLNFDNLLFGIVLSRVASIMCTPQRRAPSS